MWHGLKESEMGLDHLEDISISLVNLFSHVAASMSLSQPAGTSPFQVAFAPNTLTFTANPKKRRIDDNIAETLKENKGRHGNVSFITQHILLCLK